jgi:hypothetical protein
MQTHIPSKRLVGLGLSASYAPCSSLAPVAFFILIFTFAFDLQQKKQMFK